MSQTLRIVVAVQAAVMYPVVAIVVVRISKAAAFGVPSGRRGSQLWGILALVVTSPLIVSDLRAESKESVILFFSFFWIPLGLPCLVAWRYVGAFHEALVKGARPPLRAQVVLSILGLAGLIVVVVIMNLINSS